jgi:hypothetical protein
MKIFVCPSLAGCYLPMYKSYHHFIGAENINEAKKVMEEYIEKYGDTTTFFVDKIRRDKSCEEMEETFNGIHKMMKLE